MKAILTAAAVVAALALPSATSAATQTFSFTGTFSGDADVQIFSFSFDQVSDVRLRTVSYAGGRLADGTLVPPGGFDPILTLYDGSGAFIFDIDDSPDVDRDPVTGNDFDVDEVIDFLVPGDYFLALTQYDNFSAGPSLRDGFRETDPFFTSRFPQCAGGQFCDSGPFSRPTFRTGAWAVEIGGVDRAAAVVPLPAPVFLLVTGLLALAAFKFTAPRGRSLLS